jgi:hypothetical protein
MKCNPPNKSRAKWWVSLHYTQPTYLLKWRVTEHPPYERITFGMTQEGHSMPCPYVGK